MKNFFTIIILSIFVLPINSYAYGSASGSVAGGAFGVFRNSDNNQTPGQVLGEQTFRFEETTTLKQTPLNTKYVFDTVVFELQTKLLALGINPGPLDGKFGPLTKDAVMKFQVSRGLVADGVVGPLTIAELNK